MHTIDFSSSLYYSNRQLIPVQDMATALVAYGRIIEMSAPVITNLAGIADPISVQVFLKELRAGSADEGFVNRFVFKNEKDKLDFIHWLRSVTLVEQMQEKNPTLGKLWAYILVGGAMLAVGRYGLPKASPVHMKNVSAAIINVGGNITIPHESIEAAMSSGIRNRSALAANAVKVIRPAKHDKDALIRIDGREELTIPPQAISEVPAMTGNEAEAPTTSTLRNVEIHVRAIDRDSTAKGWAAIVPSFSDRRAKLELDPSIDACKLARQEVVTGDVEVTARVDRRGRETPKKYFLIRTSSSQ